MKMKKNVDTIDALLRITMGLTGVAWGTTEMIRRPNRITPLVITMASAMKVAEGITRYCPMLDLLDKTPEGVMENTREAMHEATDRIKETMRGTRREAAEATDKAKEAIMNEPLKEILEEYR